MAFKNPLRDLRADEVRPSNGLSRDSLPAAGQIMRSNSGLDAHAHPTVSDMRHTLQRRSTTDSSSLPHEIQSIWDSSGVQHPYSGGLDLRKNLAPGSDSMSASGYLSSLKAPRYGGGDDRQRVQLLENIMAQKQADISHRRANSRLLELQSQKDEEDVRRLAREVDRTVHVGNAGITGRYSEPTTPPEGREGLFGGVGLVHAASGYPSSRVLGTPTSSSLADHQHLITPPAEEVLMRMSQGKNSSIGSNHNSRSVPGSRRNSDETKVQTAAHAPMGHPHPLHQNLLNSSSSSSNFEKPLPSSNGPSHFGLGPHSNTSVFLFEDEPDTTPKKTADSKAYFMMDPKADFPTLKKHSYSGSLSSSSAALDLAYASNGEAFDNHQPQSMWPSNFTRSHRPAQHSLPANYLPYTPNNNSSPKVMSQTDAPAGTRRYERSTTSEYPLNNYSDSPMPKLGSTQMPKLQASFSTSDLPTVRNLNLGSSTPHSYANRPPAERQSHSREPSIGSSDRPLNGGTLTFGPPLASSINSMQSMIAPNISPLPSPNVYNGFPGISPAFHAAAFGPYNSYAQNMKPLDQMHAAHGPQGRAVQKRTHDSEPNRFTNVKLESLVDEIYSLCKDQHGCRFLQKKLEEGNPQHVEIIFKETHEHVVDLMTDPFGNYLCQKLLEYANDEQRTVLVTTASPRLVDIALNQHGTRALQKMIEFLSTAEQIDTIVHALESKVVDLIQDLNGNHVIQKCLNRLKPLEAQFIFDAVGEHCVVVGTHRHGCCVLQRCIDHASGNQQIDLIRKITAHSLELVQDAFGNYVVQYILDLREPRLSEPVILKFLGQLCELAKQKFSSNVIEKCIRVAETKTRKLLIEELISSGQMDMLLRDQYANYVIQTAIDYADQVTRQRLADTIIPVLPSVRHTPYGRRIQSKLTSVENKTGMSFQNPGNSPSIRSPPHSRSNSYSGSQVHSAPFFSSHPQL